MENEDQTPTIEIKENPHPKSAYRLTMAIENAPGPFGMVEGSAQYDVENRHACGKRNLASGTVSRMTHMPDLHWKPDGATTYTTTVYPGLLVDEDYYGNGVCRWKLMGASALLRATGAETETRFLPAIDIEDILSEKKVTLYFWGKGYPTEPGAAPGDNGFPDFGYKDPSKFRSELRGELFTITLTAKEVQP